MKRIAILVLLSIPVYVPATATTVSAKEVQKAAPELIVDVDVNDEVMIRQHPMTEADIKDLVTQLKQNGCQTLLIRCGYLGFLPYRTKLSYPVGFDAEHARAFPGKRIFGMDKEQFITEWSKKNRRYAEAIRNVNPPEAFVRAGHALGMKVIAWIEIFDDGCPGFHSKFLDEHPHCQWVGKDNKTYFTGVMDYSWPESRAFRVAQAEELLGFGFDGIHCSTSAHGRHMPNTHEIDFYGYSQPIVDAFKRKYGVDIRTADNFDKVAWHDLKGEAMVQLYRDLAKVCHDRNKKLWVGLQLGRYTQLSVDPHFSAFVAARYSNHWKKLVDERIADAFILGDYELVSDLKCETWNAKPDIQLRKGEDLFDWAAREYRDYCTGKTRLYLFGEWLPSDVVKLDSRLRFWTKVLKKTGFDGIDIHEAMYFEEPKRMKLLWSMAKRLRESETKKPSP